jgi:hypothetical protein
MGNGTACFVAAVVLFGFGGCGDSSKGGGSGGRAIATSVSGSKTFSSLTPAEVTQVCQDIAPGVFDASCRHTGEVSAEMAVTADPTLTDAQLAAACTDSRDQCETQLMPMDCANVTVPPDCSATVAEYVACLVDLFAQVPACAGLTRAAIDATATAPRPASCVTFMDKCAGLAPL